MKVIKKVLIKENEIKERVKELAQKITKDYQGKEVVVVCVLKGAFMFFSDLVREIDLPITIDFMSLFSYDGDKSTHEIVVKKDISVNIMGKNVIIVDDIIDTGYTAQFVKKYLAAREPQSVKFVALLDKPERREINQSADYFCFIIPNEFVVGYGLDYNEQFRNLKDIVTI